MTGDGYRLAFDRAALKYLKRIRKGDAKSAQRIVQQVERLTDDPSPHGS